MSGNLLKFDFEGHTIEADPTNGEPLFDAVLVAKALGYKKPHDAIARHVDQEDSVKRGVLTGGGKQTKIFIREPGLWALALRADTDAAKRFRRWVTSEVLPAIRQFGRYEPGLQVKIAAYIGEKMAAWSQMFPREFWLGLDRLYQVKRDDENKRPLFYAQCVQLVYETLDRDVYAVMKIKVPKKLQESGVRQHQALSMFGREETSRHVWRCIGMMDSCTSGEEWKRLLRSAFGRQPQLPLKGVVRKSLHLAASSGTPAQ